MATRVPMTVRNTSSLGHCALQVEKPRASLGLPDVMAVLIFLSMVALQPCRALMCFHPYFLVPQRSVYRAGPRKYSLSTCFCGFFLHVAS